MTFRDVLWAAIDTHGFTDQELAEMFGVSRPTIERWKSGKNEPHPAMHLPVYKRLIQGRGRGKIGLDQEE